MNKEVALNASLVGWLTVTVLWISAVYFLIQMRNQKFRDTVECSN
jgi:hypothetical protein